jgi:hypothetical protein
LEKGWLVALIAMFGCTSILALFSYGVVFNILNVYIILMVMIFCAIKWLSTKKVRYLVGALLLGSLFCVLHPSGLYLPIASLVLLVGLFAYKIIKGWKPQIWRYTIIPVIILAVGVIGYYFVLENSIHGIKFQFSYHSSWLSLLVSNLTWFIVILGTLAVAGLVMYRKTLVVSNEVKYILWILGSIAVSLVGVCLLSGGYQPARIILDLGTIISIIIGVLMLLVMKAEKDKGKNIITAASYVLVSSVVFFNLLAWIK